MEFELTPLEQIAVSPFGAWFILMQAADLFSLSVFAILTGILLPGIAQAYRRNFAVPHKLIKLSVAAAAYPISIALIGGVFWDSGYSAIIYMLYATSLGYLGIFSYLLFRESGWRIYIFSIGGFCLIFSVMTLFVTTMAISGTWL
jgi:hypothetical protein